MRRSPGTEIGGSLVTASACSDPAVTRNVRYYYKVKAGDAAGNEDERGFLQQSSMWPGQVKAPAAPGDWRILDRPASLKGSPRHNAVAPCGGPPMRSAVLSFLSSLAFAALASGLAAQPGLRVRTVPRAFAGTYAPGANLLPFARSRVFIQYWIHGGELKKNWPIVWLGWRVDRRVSNGPVRYDMEIVLASTSKGFSTLSKTFKNNLGNAPTTFLKRKRINLPAQNAPNNPDQPALWIQGDRPFVFTGPNLVIQVDGLNGVNSRYYTNAYVMSAASPSLHLSGAKGCDNSRLQGSFAPGSATYTLRLIGGRPNRPAVLLLGLDNRELPGGVPLPFDLGVIGAPGCKLGVAPLVSAPVVLDGSGSMTTSTVTGFARTFTLFAQMAVSGAQNRLGWSLSNVNVSLMGPAGLTTYLYNWTRFGPTAQYGPYPTNRGPVLLTRP